MSLWVNGNGKHNPVEFVVLVTHLGSNLIKIEMYFRKFGHTFGHTMFQKRRFNCSIFYTLVNDSFVNEKQFI